MNASKLLDCLDIEMGFIDKNTHGDVNLNTGKIRLNVETMVVEVLIHETMHLCHPMLNRNEDEEVINDLTARVWKRLSARQIRFLARKVLGRKYVEKLVGHC